MNFYWQIFDRKFLLKRCVFLDIHLRNVLVKPSSAFDRFSIEQFYKEYGEPETVSVTQRNGKALPPNVPDKAVIPLYLGKDAEKFSLSDTEVLLSDFGEAFSPGVADRLGEDCHTPLFARPPEAILRPQAPLSYSADIWSLATAIWDIIGMKAIFGSEFMTSNEVVSNQMDLMGSLPSSWWEQWNDRSRFFQS